MGQVDQQRVTGADFLQRPGHQVARVVKHGLPALHIPHKAKILPPGSGDQIAQVLDLGAVFDSFERGGDVQAHGHDLLLVADCDRLNGPDYNLAC